MKRAFAVLFIILAVVTHGSAQSYLKTDIGIKTSIEDTDYEIQFFSPSIVRVLKSPEESCFTKESLSVIKRPQNTSLSFIETMARLYYRRHDHLDIARKRFTYFLEFLRSRYFINTAVDENRIISEVSRKSGVSERSVAALFSMGNRLHNLKQISQEDLEQFNRQIEFFYNNCR